MTATGGAPRVRRVLVAIDASPHSVAALQAAVELAAARRLELLALFVEDVRLLNATALPFAREVGSVSGVARPLDRIQTERRFQDLARRVEAMVAAAAARTDVPWAFRVRRGLVAAEILANLEPTDLLSLGAAGWSPLRSRGLGETAGDVLHRTHHPVLVARHGARLRMPLLVLLEGRGWRRTLETAVAVSGPVRGGLVLVVAPGHEQAAREDQAQDLLASLGAPPCRVRLLAGAGPAALRAAVRREFAGGLVLPADAEALRPEAGEPLLASADVPVLVVPTADDVASAHEDRTPGQEKAP